MPRPLVRLRSVRVGDFASCSGLGPRSLLELTELSSNPRLTGEAAEIKIVAPSFGGQLQLAISHRAADKKHHLRFSIYDLDVVPLIAARRVTVAGGHAQVSGEGSVDRHSVDARLTVDIDLLAAEIIGGGSWAGIDPAVFNRGLRRLNGFRADLLLTGNFRAPALRVGSESLIAEFKQRLRSAGEFALAETIEREVARRRPSELGLAVVPASAVEPQTNRPRPDLAEFTQETKQTPAEPEPVAAVNIPAAPDGMPSSYPTTETPDEDSQYSAPPAPPSVAQTVARMARPLPGPMNLMVGHDPAVGFSSTFDRVGAVRRQETVTAPQASTVSRWAQGLRQRFGQVASQPAAAQPVAPRPSEPPIGRQVAEQPDAVIPAAASEAWYNRRWR